MEIVLWLMLRDLVYKLIVWMILLRFYLVSLRFKLFISNILRSLII